jgi:protease IV
MKAFFASFIGTLLALAAFVVVSALLLVGGFAVLSTLGQPAAVSVPDQAYLVINLDGTNLTDIPPPLEEGGLARLFQGDEPRSLGLRPTLAALRHAATDDRLVGVYLTGNFAPSGYGSGFAAVAELRAALREVSKAGKPVRAYFDEAGAAELHLASVADEIVLNPFGLIILPGLASEPMFYGDAFERWGVGVQVTRTGKYKGAIEPFTRRDLSPENREQLTVLLEDLWKNLRDDIARAREITPEKLQALVDAEGLISSELANDLGLVSSVAYRDEILARLREDTGVGANEPFAQISLRDYLKTVPAATPSGRGDRRIAVVYAEGEIVDGEGYLGEIGGASYARELRALREDDEVAAVVLRVNSPGGSASASEEILRELRLLAAQKPLVVSMGSYAASGGYWIAAFGERIFAQPSTVTGSIGVFGVQFDLERLAGSVGLTWDRVQIGEKAGMLTAARPKTEAELAVFQRLVDRTYAEFLQRVSEGRKLDVAAVHQIAQGRVWSGTQAVALGLADELGGLDAAIAHAAQRAGIEGEPDLQEYPGIRPIADVFSDLFSGGEAPEARLLRPSVSLPRGPVGRTLANLEEQLIQLDRYNDPRGVYARLPLDLRLR